MTNPVFKASCVAVAILLAFATPGALADGVRPQVRSILTSSPSFSGLPATTTTTTTTSQVVPLGSTEPAITEAMAIDCGALQTIGRPSTESSRRNAYYRIFHADPPKPVTEESWRHAFKKALSLCGY